MKFRSTMMRTRDAEPKPRFEEVRDQFSPDNPYPASTSEICGMSPEQYRQWKMTGKKPCAADSISAEEAAQARVNGVFVQEDGAADRFARASDRIHGHRSALTGDDLAGLSPVEQFSARSAAKWASRDPRGRIADLRRRRSE
jgi:hypothetical protein